MRQNSILKVGLTGGIGSGKSTVSKMFKDECIPVIDADVVSREVHDLYPKIKEKIKAEFGESFFDEKGKLKRRELGNFIFSDSERRKKLEDIVIPYIKEEIFLRIDQYNNNGEKMCILDMPTLIEQDLHKCMDVNILVWVDKITQINRVKSRDKFSDEQIENRIKSQMDLDSKIDLVDYVIDNTSDIEYTLKQFNNIMVELRNLR